MPEVLRGRWRVLLLPWLAIAACAALALPSLASATPTATTGDIVGTVTEGGTGVAGLTVVAYPAGTNPVDNVTYDSGSGASSKAETTGATGAFDLSNLAPGSYTVLALPTSADGYVATYSNGATAYASATTVSVTANANTSGTTVAMVPGATVSGSITSPSGTGVGGVNVQLYDAGGYGFETPVSNGSGGVTSGPLYAKTATTGTIGSYQITGVPPGINLYADVFGSEATTGSYADVWFANSPSEAGAQAIVGTSGKTSTVSQALSTAGSITGTVDNGSGAFTGGGYVTVLTTDGGEVDSGGPVSTATGQYTVTGLLPGSYILEFEPDNTATTFWATGFLTGSGLTSAEATATPISVTSGSSATATTFSVVSGGSISGAVTTGGSAAGDVKVTLYDANGNPAGDREDFGSAYTNSDGTYYLGGVNDGDFYYLPGSYKVGFAVSPTYEASGANLAFQYYNNASTLASATTVTVAGSGANTSGINAALVTGGTMTGKVTAASSGAGLADAEVDLEDANGNVLASTDTNPDGTYSLPQLPTGTYYVEFDSPIATLQDQYYGGKQVLAGSTTVSVTAGQTTSNINAALTASTTGAQTVTTTTTTTVAAAIPTIVGATPAITGTAKVGYTLTAKTGVWTAGTTFRYQWYAAGKAVAGATAATFKVPAADYRKVIQVVVVGAESGFYSTTKSSAATKAVAAGTLAAKVPTITGTKKVGDKLTAKSGVWTAGTKFTYQWYANGKAIKGATKSTFKLVAAEKGKKITVRVTGKLTGYTTVAKSSKATAKVA